MLLPVHDIKLFKATTGEREIDYILDYNLLHLELEVENNSFIMGSIPTYIAKTLYEHIYELRYSYRFFSLLNKQRIPGNPFHRIKDVTVDIQYDNRSCHLQPLNIAWCDCEHFTAIDMTRFTTPDNKELQADLYTGLLLAVMYDAPIIYNNESIQDINVVQIQNELGVSILAGKHTILLKPPEPIVAFFSQFKYSGRKYTPADNRLSIEALVLTLQRYKERNIVLKTITITELLQTGSYVADVKFSIDDTPHEFRMIPSHAVLAGFLLGEGQIFVEDTLLAKT